MGIIAFSNGWEVIKKKDSYRTTGRLRAAIFVIMIIIGLGGSIFGGLPIGSSYICQKSFPAEYNAIKTTIENARPTHLYRSNPVSGFDIERAALANKIIEINQYLASVKYWNSCAYGIFDWAYPDEVVKLPMLKTAYE